MKLASKKYNESSEEWYSAEYIPNNPRSILIYTVEGGTAEGQYINGKWIQYRWSCEVDPLFWREMPRYHGSNNNIQR